MASVLVVRPASDRELDAAGRIGVAAYRAAGQIDQDSDDGYARVLADARNRAEHADVLVAVRDGDVVGTVTMCPPGSPFREIATDDEMEFRFLAVDPAAWGTGVGDALVCACEEYARSARSIALVIGVRDTNAEAKDLYRRFSFSRLPDRDFQPVPGVLLWCFRKKLD